MITLFTRQHCDIIDLRAGRNTVNESRACAEQPAAWSPLYSKQYSNINIKLAGDTTTQVDKDTYRKKTEKIKVNEFSTKIHRQTDNKRTTATQTHCTLINKTHTATQNLKETQENSHKTTHAGGNGKFHKSQWIILNYVRNGARVQGDGGARTVRDVTQARRRMRIENTASDIERYWMVTRNE